MGHVRLSHWNRSRFLHAAGQALTQLRLFVDDAAHNRRTRGREQAFRQRLGQHVLGLGCRYQQGPLRRL